jgi:hypothetical protein
VLDAVQHDKDGENEAANESDQKQYVEHRHEDYRFDRDLPLESAAEVLSEPGDSGWPRRAGCRQVCSIHSGLLSQKSMPCTRENGMLVRTAQCMKTGIGCWYRGIHAGIGTSIQSKHWRAD